MEFPSAVWGNLVCVCSCSVEYVELVALPVEFEDDDEEKTPFAMPGDLSQSFSSRALEDW